MALMGTGFAAIDFIQTAFSASLAMPAEIKFSLGAMNAHQLWATTRHQGDRVQQNGAWLALDDSSGLAANDVTDISFASSRAWSAIYSEGIAVASIPNPLRAVKQGDPFVSA